jgi:hypothetical protein
MIVSAVSKKVEPRARENRMDAASRSAKIGKSTFNRNATPTANPKMASAMAASTIQSPLLTKVRINQRYDEKVNTWLRLALVFGLICFARSADQGRITG